MVIAYGACCRGLSACKGKARAWMVAAAAARASAALVSAAAASIVSMGGIITQHTRTYVPVL